MSNFLKSFFSFGLATSIEKLLGFVLLPIYTRYFNTNEYGTIDLITTILNIVVVFGVIQLETSLQRYYYEFKENRKKKLISAVYFWVILASLCVTILLFFLAPILAQWFFQDRSASVSIKLVAFQVPFYNLSMLGLLVLRYERENFKFLSVVLLKVLCNLIFVFLFVVYLKMGLEGVFIAQLLAIFTSTCLVTYFVHKNIVFSFPRWITAKVFNYALPMFPARIGSMLLGQSNRFFILGYLSLSAVGIYSVAFKVASSIQIFNIAFNMAWAPFMHQQFKNDKNKPVFASAFIVVSAITFLLVCWISLFGIELVRLLATEEFYSASKYIGGISLFFALYIVKETVDIGPKLREKTKYLSYTFFVSVLTNVLSLFIFVQYLGLEGVVYSLLITNLVLVGLSWYVSNRLYYIPFNTIKFILLLTPAFLLSMGSMFYSLDLAYRSLCAVLVFAFYLALCKADVRRLQSLSR